MKSPDNKNCSICGLGIYVLRRTVRHREVCRQCEPLARLRLEFDSALAGVDFTPEQEKAIREIAEALYNFIRDNVEVKPPSI